ncbi:MAG: penicillin acylase family protein [Gammaproteobacteria bacterium]|nr:penicillin acylase family protein [Gammaproteobacteria bacterium]
MSDKLPRARLWRRLGWIFGGFVLLLAMVVIAGYLWLRQSLPQLEGEILTAGVTHRVTVSRDADGVPTVQAANRVDASYALGYLHGQERFFQMDLLRRSGAGELSELLGDATLEFDKKRRRHRFRHRSERAAENFSDADLLVASAYTSGVNDGLKALGAVPFEYTLLGVEPAAWSNMDSLLVVYAMYFTLQDSDNRYERNYSLAHDVMGKELVEFLVPFGTTWDAPVDGGALPLAPIPVDAPESGTGEQAPTVAMLPVDAAVPGSNNWVLGGSLTATGAAIVANDMHLGLGVPNIWYRVRLVIGEPGTDITGVSLPGAAAIVVGSNTDIAWGFTNSQTDTQDIVLIDWIDEAAGSYRTPSGPAKLEIVNETICSSSGKCDELPVRETVWGPLLEFTDHAGRAMVTHWIAHYEGAANTHLMQMENARTLEDAFAVAHRAGTPAQNLVVGDRHGNIGYTLLGPVPARFGHSGILPASWSDGSRGWSGRLLPPGLPVIINPPQDRLWSANARIVSGDWLQNVGFGNYALAGRQHQVRERMMALESADEDDLFAIQLDDEALFLARWRALMLEHFANHTDSSLAAALDKVERWEGRAVPESIGYRVVRRFRSHVTMRVISGLTEPLQDYLGERFPWYSRTVEGPAWRLVNERPAHLLPPGYDDWNALVDAAMADVIAEISSNGGLEKFTWGAYAELRIDHPLSSFVPALAWLTDPPVRQASGEFSNMPRIAAGSWGASERMVVSPGREENGIFQMPSGQSGHPLSPYYNKGHENWVRGTKTPFLPGEAKWILEFQPDDS